MGKETLCSICAPKGKCSFREVFETLVNEHALASGKEPGGKIPADAKMGMREKMSVFLEEAISRGCFQAISIKSLVSPQEKAI